MGFIRDKTIGMSYSVDKDGASMSRNFIVSNLPNLSSTLYLATQSAGIPQMWQAHESIPNLYVNSISAVPFAGDSRINVAVTCNYNWLNLQNGQFRLTGSRQVIHANKDPATQKFFTVTYGVGNQGLQAVFGAALAAAGLGNKSNYCDFDVFTCHLSLEFQRIESGNPKKKAAQYVGTTNSDAGWQGIGKQGEWLCESINGEQIGAGNYLNNYCFQRAPEGWFQLGFFQDSFTRIVPADVTSQVINVAKCQKSQQVANGIYCYAPEQQAFSGLNIPNA